MTNFTTIYSRYFLYVDVKLERLFAVTFLYARTSFPLLALVHFPFPSSSTTYVIYMLSRTCIHIIGHEDFNKV